MALFGKAARLTRKVSQLLLEAPRQALTIDLIRTSLSAIRFIWFVKVRRNIQVYDTVTGAVAKNTLMHNIKGMRDVAVNRSHLILRPLVSIDQVRLQQKTQRVLSIGPRSEGEIYNLIGYGFNRTNITALDLISYSPMFELGDMHAMRYPDSTFDICISGWVIAYSDDKKKAAAEMVRVTKPGGLIAIGCESHPETNEEIVAAAGYLPGSQERIHTLDQIMRLFDGHVQHVFFSHPLADFLAGRTYGQLMAIFSVKK